MLALIKGVMMVFTQYKNIRNILIGLVILIIVVPIAMQVYNMGGSIGSWFGYQKPEVVAAKKKVQVDNLRDEMGRKDDVAVIQRKESATSIKVIVNDINNSRNIDTLEDELLGDIQLIDESTNREFIHDDSPRALQQAQSDTRELSKIDTRPKRSRRPISIIGETLISRDAPNESLAKPPDLVFSMPEAEYREEGKHNIGAIYTMYERVLKIKE